MKSFFILTAALLTSFALVSCFPIPEDKPRKRTNTQGEATITSEEQQQIEAQREMIKQRELEKQQTAQNPTASTDTASTQTQTQTQSTATKTAPTSDYPFANPVPGKPGFVFNPYNNEMVDVRDIPSGTLVRDPTYPESEKKFYRVP